MLIRGEKLDYLNVQGLVENIFGDTQHAKRVKSIANAALGIVNSASLIVHRIGQGLAKTAGLLGKHAVKQVDRLLSNPKLVPWDCFSDWVPFIVGGRREIVVAMDWTDFDADSQATLAINMVTSHGRATPLLWHTVFKAELKDRRNDYEDALLTRLAQVLPPGIKVTVLADRGFGEVRLYDFLQQTLGFHFVIRFRGNIKVTDENEETRSASDWVGPGGRARTLRNARVTAEGHLVPTVVCVKAPDMKEPWCIASSEPEAVGSILVRWYSKRWGIEPQFRDTKDIHFGMGLSQTRIKSPERRDRLLLISALAVAVLTLLGAAGERLGMDRYLKVNTVARRTHSLFRQGCYYFGLFHRMAENQLKKLLECFSDLVSEQRSMLDLVLRTI